MRVIAGSARHIQLTTVDGMDTRPTTDRIKETLFNMLQFEIADATVLDLFSGSGAIGIEALSRGAKEVVFVENLPKALQCIESNLKATHLEKQATIYPCDVIAAITRLDGRKAFDFIFIDPPYQQGFEPPVLKSLANSSLVEDDTRIIVEASKEASFDFVSECQMQIEKEKIYKTNKHVFLRLVRRTK